jgi:hypothetical protein
MNDHEERLLRDARALRRQIDEQIAWLQAERAGIDKRIAGLTEKQAQKGRAVIAAEKETGS